MEITDEQITQAQESIKSACDELQELFKQTNQLQDYITLIQDIIDLQNQADELVIKLVNKYPNSSGAKLLTAKLQEKGEL